MELRSSNQLQLNLARGERRRAHLLEHGFQVVLLRLLALPFPLGLLVRLLVLLLRLRGLLRRLGLGLLLGLRERRTFPVAFRSAKQGRVESEGYAFRREYALGVLRRHQCERRSWLEGGPRRQARAEP